MAVDLAADGQDWAALWAFSCGLADSQGAEDLAPEAALFAAHAVTPVPTLPVPWYRPTEGAAAQVARDAYGDRFLVAAPFSDPARPAAVDHWYAWDLDWCANDLVVAAGVYDSADAARAEWQAVVGPAAATAEFSPCPPELGRRLLSPAQPDSVQLEMVFGDEPAQFFREIPRLSRRAAALADSLGNLRPDQRSAGQADDRDAAIDDFLDWHTGHAWNAPGDRDEAEEALELILSEWGPDVPAGRARVLRLLTAPHRVHRGHPARLLRPRLGQPGAAPAARLGPVVRPENQARHRVRRPRPVRRPHRSSISGWRSSGRPQPRGTLSPPGMSGRGYR